MVEGLFLDGLNGAGWLAGLFWGLLVFGIILYVYMGFAYTAVGRKAKVKTPELAWIPFVGPTIVTYQAAGMHWWPWLLLIGMIIPFLNVLAAIAFQVMVIVWTWHMFEKIKRPGWWAILFILPIVGLVMIGIAAWTEPDTRR